MKINIDYGKETYFSKLQLADGEKEIGDIIETFSTAVTITFFDMLDCLEEDRSFEIDEEMAKKIMEVTVASVQYQIKNCIKEYSDGKTQNRLYGYMEDIFNSQYLELKGITEEEFIKKYSHVKKPEDFGYDTACDNGKIKIYMSDGDKRECIFTEDIDTYRKLSPKKQEARCIIAECIIIIAGDKLFTQDSNPMRGCGLLHKKLADEIRELLEHTTAQNELPTS